MQIHKLTMLVVAAVAAAVWVGPAHAAPSRPLEAQLKRLLDQVADALDKDVELKGRTISLGRFSSETRPDSNYGPELRRLFEQRLKKHLVPDGLLKLSVDYDIVPSETDVAAGDPPDKKMTVLLITALIKDRQKKELFRSSVEVNETADIARVMGLTVSPPPNGTQANRNDELERIHKQNQGKPADQVRPTFQVRDRTKIGIPGNDRFLVEILVKDSPDGPGRAIAPTATPRGEAFVDIKPNQFYDVVIYNYDRYDCVARVLIDNQDALNRFNMDGVNYPGLLIGSGQSGVLRGWMHTVKPRPKEKDNVFAFAVKEYAHGSAAPIANTAEIGVITVQFAVAWKDGETPPAGRQINPRFTDKGPGLEQNFQVVKRHIGEFNETISIRYSPR